MLSRALFGELSGAEYSDCKRYRYRLWRQWNADLPVITFVMLNPSTATATANDPTVERCQRRAIEMGYGTVRVANIFALRSTDPQGLYAIADPVGDGNDAAILDMVSDADMVIAAWGTHGKLAGRGREVVGFLRGKGINLHCLGVNTDGSPKHPLYVGYSTRPMPYGHDHE